MARIPFAEWRPIGTIQEEPPITPTVLIFHTMAGFLLGSEATFKAKGFFGTESTFGVGGPADGRLDGALYQWQDTHREADAQAAGNAYANSVETSDGRHPTNPWSSKQIKTLVRLTVAWCKLTGNPCELVKRTEDRGLGYHAQFSVWNPDNHGCPGPVRLGQLRQIVIPKARAQLTRGLKYKPPKPPSKRSKRPLAEDGVLGLGTIAVLQRRLRVDDDGIMGPETRVALEIDLGVRPDGLLSGADVKALQGRLGVPKNGIWGPRTTVALQRALNAGTF
jgi:hypothetical protein